MSLFRKEAIDFQRDKYLGDVIVTRPRWHTFFLISLLLVISVIFLFLAFGKYNRKEIVNGYLLSKTGVSTVQSTVSGTVRNIFVEDGETVVQGEELILIENYHGLPQGKEMIDSLVETLQLRIEEIEAQKNSILNQKNLKVIDNNRTIETTRKNIKLLKNNYKLIEQKISHSYEKLSSAKIMYEKKLLSKIDLQEISNEHLKSQDELNGVSRQLNNETHLKNQAAIDIENQDLLYGEKLKDLNQRKLEIQEKIINISSQKHFVIKSPVNGKISFVNIEVGQQINDDVLLAIIPDNDEIEAELLVPPAAIGFIAKNQRVFMRYSAFPYQKFGLQNGAVKSVSKSVLLPHEMRKVPIQMNEPAYKVRIKLDKQTVTAYGQEFLIKPGMILNADIELEQRSLFEWLFEPLFSLKGRI